MLLQSYTRSLVLKKMRSVVLLLWTSSLIDIVKFMRVFLLTEIYIHFPLKVTWYQVNQLFLELRTFSKLVFLSRESFSHSSILSLLPLSLLPVSSFFLFKLLMSLITTCLACELLFVSSWVHLWFLPCISIHLRCKKESSPPLRVHLVETSPCNS